MTSAMYLVLAWNLTTRLAVAASTRWAPWTFQRRTPGVAAWSAP